MRECRLGKKERRREIDREDAIPLFLRNIGEMVEAHDPRTVDQQGKIAKLLDTVRHRLDTGLPATDVRGARGYGIALAAQFSGSFLQPVRQNIDEKQRVPIPAQRVRYFLAQPTRCSGDERCLCFHLNPPPDVV